MKANNKLKDFKEKYQSQSIRTIECLEFLLGERKSLKLNIITLLTSIQYYWIAIILSTFLSILYIFIFPSSGLTNLYNLFLINSISIIALSIAVLYFQSIQLKYVEILDTLTKYPTDTLNFLYKGFE